MKKVVSWVIVAVAGFIFLAPAAWAEGEREEGLPLLERVDRECAEIATWASAQPEDRVVVPNAYPRTGFIVVNDERFMGWAPMVMVFGKDIAFGDTCSLDAGWVLTKVAEFPAADRTVIAKVVETPVRKARGFCPVGTEILMRSDGWKHLMEERASIRPASPDCDCAGCEKAGDMPTHDIFPKGATCRLKVLRRLVHELKTAPDRTGEKRE